MCVHLRKLGKSKSYREEHGQFLCDGRKLLEEALESGAVIDIVLTTVALEYVFPDNTYVYFAHDSLIDSISPLQTSQNILFVCRFPQFDIGDFTSGTHLLLDNIQDPGNVGTIMRTAHAFDIKSVILTEGSADIFNPKTIRASMGAVFKQPTYSMDFNDIKKLKDKKIKFIGSSNNNCSINIKDTAISNSIIILGNEGQGISRELIDVCDVMVKIPLSPNCESLNVAVAASIISWEVWNTGRK